VVKLADVTEVYVYITHEGFVRAQDTPVANWIEHRRFVPASTRRSCVDCGADHSAPGWSMVHDCTRVATHDDASADHDR
jgi:hypothetical protein